MTFKIFKEVATLPAAGSLQPDAIYAVRVGAGFDLYVTNVDSVAIPINVPALKTVNGQAITGTGNIVTSISFATDADAIAYSNANPGVTVGSTQV